jgi:hypothetical protein
MIAIVALVVLGMVVVIAHALRHPYDIPALDERRRAHHWKNTKKRGGR